MRRSTVMEYRRNVDGTINVPMRINQGSVSMMAFVVLEPGDERYEEWLAWFATSAGRQALNPDGHEGDED